MKNSKPQFVHLYKAYAHLRSKHWVVRAGLQFGADFMAYRHHPALVHSDYAVVVMWEMHEQRLNTWAEMQAMSRLCGSVAKVHEKILQMGVHSPSLVACRFHYVSVQLTAHLCFLFP